MDYIFLRTSTQVPLRTYWTLGSVMIMALPCGSLKVVNLIYAGIGNSSESVGKSSTRARYMILPLPSVLSVLCFQTRFRE